MGMGNKKRAYTELKPAQQRYEKSPAGKLIRRASNRRQHYKKRYGISIADYDKLLLKQSGVCAICGAAKPGGIRTHFQVDHCHITGKVRGLLCHNCNAMLGYAQDNAGTLFKALSYITVNDSTIFPDVAGDKP